MFTSKTNGSHAPAGAFSGYDLEHGESRTTQEALDEIARELNVRCKCFDRWVAEKKMSPEEADQRLGSMIKAFLVVRDSMSQVTSNGDLDKPAS